MTTFKPRNDKCDVCGAHDEVNLGDEDYAAHVARKEAPKKKRAVERAAKRNPTMAVGAINLQGVLTCPKTNASALYYRRKLIVHKTYFGKRSKSGHCYFFAETVADLEGPTFSELHYRHLNTFPDEHPEVENIILWSDGCHA